MKRLKQLLSSFAIFLIAASCQKSEDNIDNDTSKMALLTKAAWKYEDAGLDLNKDGVKDTELPPGFVLACDKDNVLTFKSDGTGTLDEGASKCDQANPQTSAFTWSFKNDETVINFSDQLFSGIEGDITLKSLTSTRMEILKEVSVGASQSVNAIVILKH